MKEPLALIIASLALAPATAALAQPLTREDFQAALAERDQQIAALEKRIAALEAERAPTAASATPLQGAAGPTAAPPSAGSAASGGQIAANDDVALQALSRGLVQRGLLLLAPWSFELTPSLSYSHSQTQGLTLVDTAQGVSIVDSQRRRDDDAQAELSGRLGLPWRSQIQVAVPFDWRRDEVALGDGTDLAHSQASIGDIQIELSHQFLVEKGWVPDLIGAVSWRAPTGRSLYQVPVAAIANGSGANQITGRLTALKTIDPLVVFSTLSYTQSLNYRVAVGDVHDGNAVDFQVGGLLAVSPETSLSFTFDQQFKGHTSVNGTRIAGSDGVAAIAELGLDQVLNSRTLLDITLGFGLSNDAPDYSIMVSLPIRLR